MRYMFILSRPDRIALARSSSVDGAAPEVEKEIGVSGPPWPE